jgi:hypothetical protein
MNNLKKSIALLRNSGALTPGVGWWKYHSRQAAAALLLVFGLSIAALPVVQAAVPLPPERQLQQNLPPAALGMQLGPLLPKLLGLNGPATYLILIQNNDELRATGGFISAFGLLTLENARITELDFVDSYVLFREDLPYPPAPPPMQRYMAIPLLTLRDANWSPDLPTSAQLLQTLYRRETGRQVDGIVTLDLRAVELFLSALEPLYIEGSDEPIVGATVIEQIKQLYSVPASLDADIETAGLGPWWMARKEFIPALARSARTRVESGTIDLFKLLAAVQTATSERALQLWLDDPVAQAQIAQLGWDGGLHPAGDADFLALVDTNMGYNKVDAVIQRSLAYEVAWPAGDQTPAQATVTITYTHPLSVTDELCEATPRYGTDYDDMTERCYFNFVRLYAPGGSKLIEMDGVVPDSVKSQRGEAKTQLFSGYFTMQPGEIHVVTVTYTLPARLQPEEYWLVLQRQSGTRPLPVTLTVAGEAGFTEVVAGRLVWPSERSAAPE